MDKRHRESLECSVFYHAMKERLFRWIVVGAVIVAMHMRVIRDFSASLLTQQNEWSIVQNIICLSTILLGGSEHPSLFQDLPWNCFTQDFLRP